MRLARRATSSGVGVRLGARAIVRISSDAELVLGSHVVLSSDSTLSIFGRLSIGDGCYFNRGLYLCAREHVVISEQCIFGEQVSIHDENHQVGDTSRGPGEQGYETRPIMIGPRVWSAPTQ